MDEEQKKQAMAAAHKAARDFWDGALEDSVRVAVEAFQTSLPDEPSVPPQPNPKPDPNPQPTTDFRVFEDINYRGRPNLRGMGMEPLQIWYESAFFDDKARPGESNFKMPDRTRIQMAAERSRPVSVIDIERWWGVSDNPYPAVGIDNLEQTARIYRDYLSQGHKFGFYGTIPIRSLNKISGEKMAGWHSSNDRLKWLGKIVDMTFPSLYSLVDDDDRWEAYAIANIAEAKRIAPGKPCYPFLWPQYHPNAKQKKGQPVPGDIWREQLDLCRDLADGVVIWTLSETKNIDFDEIKNRGWWGETVDFLEGL